MSEGQGDGGLKPAAHPAKFNDHIINAARAHLIRQLWDGTDRTRWILDPMAGVGRVHELVTRDLPATDCWRVVGGELELPWARQGAGRGGEGRGHLTVQHDAMSMPFPRGVFDAVFMSPDYGNRMADAHNARDKSKRHTYTHYARTAAEPWELRPETTCKTKWGKKYKAQHVAIMREVERVLKWDGTLVLNVKNIIMNKQEVNVVGWYAGVLRGVLKMDVYDVVDVRGDGLRHGANHDARVDGEVLICARKEPF